jgi:hypothetical protein
MVRERHVRSMACVNQTRPHCVNQMGKTQYKTLAERHGRETVWYVWICLKAQGLLRFGFCHHRFESRWVHGCSSLVFVVYVGVLLGLSDLEASILRWPTHQSGCCVTQNKTTTSQRQQHYLLLHLPRNISIHSDCILIIQMTQRGKAKAVPVQVWTVPEGSRRLRLSDFQTVGT